MEHWVFEESILQTLAHLSQADELIPMEKIKHVQQQRSTQKAFEMLQRVFLGQMELELFGNVREEDESLVAMQRRIAEKYLSHDVPVKSDLAPLSQIFEANAKGKHVAQYRYLLSEVVSADIFSCFKKADITKKEEMKRLGSQLRDTLLVPGALVDVKAAAQTLLGREVSTASLFDMYGMR
jgi:Zn-dependent oligopeptidase